MNRFLTVIYLILFLSVDCFADPGSNLNPNIQQSTHQGSLKVILVVGDSLSAAYNIPQSTGWVTLLQKRLVSEQFPYRVVNISESGDTSSNGLSKLAEALKRYKPNIVIIGLGSNDGLRGLSTSALQKNLTQMIEQSEQVDAKVLLLRFLIPLNYGPLYRQKFEQVFLDLAEEYHLQKMPFLLENIALQPDLMLEDGLHPNERAQQIILETLWPYLKKLLY